MADTTYIVEGMTCEHCVMHVTKALQTIPGVSKAEVDLKTGRATLTHAGHLDGDRVRHAVEEAGYRVVKA
jgi:copper chaperone CopZ